MSKPEHEQTPPPMNNNSDQVYAAARDRYAALGVDTEHAIETLAAIPISINCWQGDDVRGFEDPSDGLSTGGIQVTGGFPGRARTIPELQADLAKALSLIPGRHRVNLHAMYGDFGGRRVDRDSIEPRHFQGWVDWAESTNIHLDFNATCFAHERAESGFTLSSTERRDPGVLDRTRPPVPGDQRLHRQTAAAARVSTTSGFRTAPKTTR